jgi:hypothetical protein
MAFLHTISKKSFHAIDIKDQLDEIEYILNHWDSLVINLKNFILSNEK